MAAIEGLNKERMLEIEAGSVISGNVDTDGNLLLERHDGTQINAGNVIGPPPEIDVATSAEILAGTDNTKMVTPSGLQLLTATELRRGIVELASTAEAEAAVSTTTAVTPAGLATTMARIKQLDRIVGTDRYLKAVSVDVDPLLVNGFVTYMQGTALLAGDEHSQPKAFKSANGWVTMRGLIQKATATAAGTVIFVLPPGYRPPQNTPVPTLAGGPSILQVYTDGRVVLGTTLAAKQWFSIGNIQFNVNPYAQLALTSPWQADNPSTWGVPSYYRSPDGITSLIGGLGGGTMNTTGLVLPAGVRLSTAVGTEAHIAAVAGSGAFGYVNTVASDGTLRPRQSTTVHLAGITLLAQTNSLQQLDVQFGNNWRNYSAAGGFPFARAARTQDGMILLHGLITGGTMGAPIFNLPRGWRPDRTVLKLAVSEEAAARLDIQANGDVVPSSGSTNWFSLDGIMFAAEG